MPFHEAIVAGALGLFKRVGGGGLSAVRFGTELAIPFFRTVGYFLNVASEKVLGRKATPAERLAYGAVTYWQNPLFIGFLSGFAYENEEEIAEGWLSNIGKIVFHPFVETDLENAIRGAIGGDFFQFMDALSEWASEETGLESLAAFFRGIKAATADWEKLTGIPVPTNWLGEFLIWLNEVMVGTFDEPFPWPWPGDPPEPLIPREPRVFPPLVGEPIRLVTGPTTYRLTTALTPTGTPLVVRTGPIGLGERGTIATKDILYTLSNLSFKGPSPSLWGILQDQIPPDVRRKFLWLLMGGGAAAQMFPGPGGAPGGDGGPPPTGGGFGEPREPR